MKKFNKEKMIELCAKDPNISLTEIAKEFSVSKERIRQVSNYYYKEEEKNRKFDLSKLKNIVFLNDLKLTTNPNDLFFVYLLNKIFKFKYNNKYKFIYKFAIKENELLQNIYLKIKKELNVLRLEREYILEKIEKVIKTDKETADKLFDVLVKENFFIKHKDYYFTNPRKSKYKYEVVEYLIARRKEDTFSFTKDNEKLIKDIRKEFNDVFNDVNDYALGKLIASMISVSKYFSLAGRAEYIINEVFVNNAIDLSDVQEFIERVVEEKEIYSLQDYWKRNKEHIEARGIDSLQGFYSLLREKNTNENISYLRYPSVFKSKYNDELKKGGHIKEVYIRNKPENLITLKEIQDYFGLSNISARQFFLK